MVSAPGEDRVEQTRFLVPSQREGEPLTHLNTELEASANWTCYPHIPSVPSVYVPFLLRTL